MENPHYIGGAKKKVAKKRVGGAVPSQLRPWHAHVARVRAMHPNLPYSEVLKKASKSYSGSGSAHNIAGRKKAVAKKPKAKKAVKKGKGVVSTVAHAIGNVAGFFGVGKPKKPKAKKAVAKKKKVVKRK